MTPASAPQQALFKVSPPFARLHVTGDRLDLNNALLMRLSADDGLHRVVRRHFCREHVCFLHRRKRPATFPVTGVESQGGDLRPRGSENETIAHVLLTLCLSTSDIPAATLHSSHLCFETRLSALTCKLLQISIW